MRTLDAQRTAEALGWRPLVEALRAVLDRRRLGLACAPQRIVMPLPGGTLLVMPASDGEYASVKLATLHEGNAARGRPTLAGEVILMRATDGERLALLDGPTVTARRTAALSALAALTLAPERRSRMLLFGSGVQARTHLDAFAELLGVREVRVISRTPAHAARFAADARSRGIDCAVLDTGLDEALARADIVVTTTPSTEPLFADSRRFAGFVAAIGAYRPQMAELPAALLHRSALYVDDLAGARTEAGDLISAGIDWSRVTELQDVLADATPPPARTPVVFKSVGQALWDLAAARLAWCDALARSGAAMQGSEP